MNTRSLAIVGRFTLLILALAAASLALCSWIYGWSFVEKLLTRCLMPTGLIWLALLLATSVAFAVKRRGLASVFLIVCLFYWTFSCTYTGDRAVRLLEGRYQPVAPQKAPRFDVVIVLGGGTSSDENGNVWLSSTGGDRLMLAARLFHAGRTDQLVVTGRLYQWSKDRGVDMSVASERILKQLGIPADRITRLSGANTAQEMQEIRTFLAKHPAERVGLLTSAFHLPRAQRLATRQGLDLHPLPAGFLAADEPFPLSCIPTSDGLRQWDVAAKEFLAAAVGR